MRAARDDAGRPFEVLERCRPALRLFTALSTQWRWSVAGAAAMGAVRFEPLRVGLDYGAIAPTARAIGVRVGEETFEQLRAMEAAALEEWQAMRSER